MAVIPVELAGRAYEVRVGGGLLADVARQCGPLLRKARVPVVTDANVAACWRETVDGSLTAAGHEPRWLVLDPGEGAKSWATLEQVVDWLLAEEVERGDHVLALGGGVIGDLVGFAASILKRGCGFVQLPTTLLAQVDSSVGGKTAINSRAGKNLVGAFHQPSLVLADLDTLGTLPAREMRAGYAEVLKYGVLGDAPFFAWCEANGAGVLGGDAAKRTYAIEQSCRAKARIVAADERETTDLRALLNLGHTFGHALEAETGFGSDLLHGESVGTGMAMAFDLSTRLGLCPAADAERVRRHLGSVGLPMRLRAIGGDNRRSWDSARLIDHMRGDKKAADGKLTFILARGIGKAFVSREVDEKVLRGLLDDAVAA
jgi:3-dehydroquinate synthase